jgi:hypothetical protein
VSRRDTLSSQPVLRCSPFLPGESLPSLVARLVILNGYSSLSILERLFQSDYPVRRERPFQESELTCLASLTRLSYAELLAASDIHITQGSPSLFVPVHPTRSAWYCPQCLAEAVYHRLIWWPISSAACLKHACQLMDGCPSCQQPVCVYDIVRSRCSYCNFYLRKAIPIPVAENEQIWISQTAMQSWLAGDSVSDLHWPRQPLRLFPV